MTGEFPDVRYASADGVSIAYCTLGNGPNDLVGARVSALAGSGEVLTTSTVRDLVAGSGITFTDRGRHVLKGVPGEWSLLAAEAPSGAV